MAISWIVFACVFPDALLDILLHATLPDRHRNQNSKGVLNWLAGLDYRRTLARARSGIGIFLAVLLVIFIAGLILQGSDKASAKAHGPDLEYLKSVNTVAP